MPSRPYILIYILSWLLASSFILPAYADEKVAADATNFISIADIHFDPFVACYKIDVKPCPLIQQLRAAPANQWSSIFNQYDKTSAQYREDTNYPLLISALSAGKKMAENTQAKFVILLGDFLSHDNRRFYKKYSGDKSFAGYQAFVKKTLEFLTLELAQTFPTIDIYPAIGNNDAYRGDYFSDQHGQFYADTAALWSRLIKDKENRNAMQRSLQTGGYYTVDIKQPSNLRIIILNSVMFSQKARGPNVDQAALAELNWLHKELALAKAEQKKVFIAMHIPVGIDVYATLRVRLWLDFPLTQQLA